MRHRLACVLMLAAVAGCSSETFGPDSLGYPTDLTYQLIPSGDPDAPAGILLTWQEPNDERVTNYVIYSRGSTGDHWSRRGETTSNTFHDAGIPHLQYYVTAEDGTGDESAPSNVVTVDVSDRLPAPTGLTSISLDRAIQLSWSDNAWRADPNRFDYYRVYSTLYDLDRGLCDGTRWALEGTTVSDDFLATGLTNGRPLCFAVSAVSRDGHESLSSVPHADTPRFDARNVIVDATQVALATSGFRFYLPSANTLGNVLPGDRADIDFKVDRLADGSMWLVPVRSDVGMTLYGASPVADLTSIDVAPATGFSRDAFEAVPGYAYVVRTTVGGELHYGALRITHVGRDYVIFDWAYQTDPGNPELTLTVPGIGQ